VLKEVGVPNPSNSIYKVQVESTVKYIINPPLEKPNDQEGAAIRRAALNCKEYLDSYNLNPDFTAKSGAADDDPILA
jgi:hypothetical protein